MTYRFAALRRKPPGPVFADTLYVGGDTREQARLNALATWPDIIQIIPLEPKAKP